MTNKGKSIHRYSDEYKATAVQLSLQEGILGKDVASALGIHPVILYRWMKDYRDGKIDLMKAKDLKVNKQQVAELRELKKLRREHELLKEEHALLKKAIRFTSEQKRRSTSS
ncbi:MAG: transposase [Bdellovibrionales bacterium]|nr:transposase [Bdellovibrionales bacterium]